MTDDLRGALDAERANAAYWREAAQRQTAALDAIKRRPTVRAALAIDRRADPYRRDLSAARKRLGRRLARARLLSETLATRRKLAARRAGLLTALDELPDPPILTRAVTVVRGAEGPAAGGVTESETAAAIRRASVTDSDLVCFLAPTSVPLEEAWLERLAATIVDGVVAATPLFVHPERRWSQATPDDLLVRTLGLDILSTDDGVPVLSTREAGTAARPHSPPNDVAAAPFACLVVDRRAYGEAGGLAPLDDPDAAAADLCWRLRARGGRIVAVPGSVVADHRAVESLADLATPIARDGNAWGAVIDRHGPALLRSTSNGPSPAEQRFALTVAAPSAKVAPRWGDWHLAQALARSLRRLGNPVRVATADRADEPAVRSCDVHVVIRGQRAVRRTSGQRHVLWIISHPESIDIAECHDADLVLVASSRFAAHLRTRTDTPVEVFLQASDHLRFRPMPPDSRHAHPVAVVAKTRDVLRPAVADALATGLRPAIYGTGWDAFVDPGLVVAEYVPNDALPVVYSSIGVLLNDHWSTMRAWGFVSNRLFDALACGTPVISDDLPEVLELFGDAVPTYRDPAELHSHVDATLADPLAARERANDGRSRVLAAHTFDHRARTLLETVEQRGLDEPLA